MLLVIEGGLETIGCVDIGVAINCFQKVESNSDADASELLANIEETCPRYYIDSNMLSAGLNVQPHTGVLPVAKELNTIYCVKY